MILLCYMFLVFSLYITYVTISFGVLPSISESYYVIGSKIPFTFFIWSISIPVLLLSDGSLLFFSGAFLGFVGASGAFRESDVRVVHVIGAIGGIGFGILSMWINFPLYYLSILIILFASISVLFRYKNFIWWIEIVSFILLFIGMVIIDIFGY